jgi:DNA modification methylase
MARATTGLAALELNRKFVGIEMNNEYFELSKQRILEKSSK